MEVLAVEVCSGRPVPLCDLSACESTLRSSDAELPRVIERIQFDYLHAAGLVRET